MGLLNFKSLPTNPLVGAGWSTFKRVIEINGTDSVYTKKYLLTKALCRLLSVAKPIQDKRYEKIKDNKPEKPPVFILGHWRSGTTYLHNVLSRDKQFGYTTTYQTVFPHVMMWGQPVLKSIVKLFMPDTRPTDSLPLDVDQPQEEEFALANMTSCSYYHFWFFPKLMQEYAAHYLTFEDATTSDKEQFKNELQKLINIALWNTGGSRFLSKNPPHTARIKELLSIYPDAKFIYLIRNPYAVFESTCNFFESVMNQLKLQDISKEELTENILAIYKMVYHKYEKEKELIPANNLIEIRFEDYKKDSLGQTKKLYELLDLGSFDNAEDAIKSYIEQQKSYVSKSYEYKVETIKLVNEHWGDALQKWNYEKL